MTTTTKRVLSGVSGGATSRVVSAATQNITKRLAVTTLTEGTTARLVSDVLGLGPFLLLSGDFEGALRLSGDEVGYLKLNGTY